MHKYILLLGVLFCAAVSAGEYPPIDVIRFEGNKETDEALLRQELGMQEGDEADPQDIEEARQAVMDTGLFKRVTARLEQTEQGTELVIKVVERYYVLPIPRVDAHDDGSYTYGLDLRFDNLFGTNQRLQLEGERTEATNGDPPSTEYSFRYSYPRFFASPYTLHFDGRWKGTETDTVLGQVMTEDYSSESKSLGVSVTRWMNNRGRSSGFYLSSGFVWREQSYESLNAIPVVGVEAQTMGATVGYGFRKVHEYPTHRKGSHYGISSEFSIAELGSDYNYERNQLFYRRYWPLGEGERPANINTQWRLGLAGGHPFGSEAYSVGGFHTLRGYEADYAEGNAMFVANLEYLHPVSRFEQLRMVAFVEAGNAWPGMEDMDLGQLHSAAGMGLRWRLEQFVNVTLTADVGYGFDEETTLVYLNTSSSF